MNETLTPAAPVAPEKSRTLYVTVPVDEYAKLVEKAALGAAMASAFMGELETSAYGVTADVNNLIAVFRALYPLDYDLWAEAAKKKESEGEE